LTIGTLAAAAGVGVETVRFYQRNDLLGIPSRGSGIRRYSAVDLRRLMFIRHAQSAGFTLAEIRELLSLDAGHDHARARQLALSRIEMLDARIAEMGRARDALSKLARQCAGNPRKPCAILSAFES